MHAYEHLAHDLRTGITAGKWRPGDALPTMRSLAADYGVSELPVRRAYALLHAEGLIYSGRARGVPAMIVRSPNRVAHYATASIDPDRPTVGRDAFAEFALRAGREPGTRFELRVASAPPDVAARLSVPLDEPVVQRVVYQLLDREPWSREASYYPRWLAETVGLDVPHDIPGGTLRQIAAAGYRETAWHDEQAHLPATPDDREDLGVALATPLLLMTRTAAAGATITRVTQLLRPADRLTVHYELGDPEGLAVIAAARAALADAT